MTESKYGLGGRLSLLEPDELSGKAKLLYKEIRKSVVPAADRDGFRSMDEDEHLIGPFNAMLYSPEMCGSFLALQKTEAEHTSLSTRVRQVVILSVGSVWKSAYELYAHSAAAKAIGITPQQADNLPRAGRLSASRRRSRLRRHFLSNLSQLTLFLLTCMQQRERASAIAHW